MAIDESRLRQIIREERAQERADAEREARDKQRDTDIADLKQKLAARPEKKEEDGKGDDHEFEA